jgi:hypothetical protein
VLLNRGLTDLLLRMVVVTQVTVDFFALVVGNLFGREVVYSEELDVLFREFNGV